MTTHSKAMETMNTPAERALDAHIKANAKCGNCAAWADFSVSHSGFKLSCGQLTSEFFGHVTLAEHRCNHWSAQ
jgi:hypothetical protein